MITDFVFQLDESLLYGESEWEDPRSKVGDNNMPYTQSAIIYFERSLVLSKATKINILRSYAI